VAPTNYAKGIQESTVEVFRTATSGRKHTLLAPNI